MMLLMGMWISLTKNPMNPMIAKPMAVAMAIFWNSKLSTKKTLEQEKNIRVERTTFTVGLGASFHQTDRVLGELLARLDECDDLVHCGEDCLW